MNRKQFVLVLLALAIVGSAGLLSLKRNQHSWSVREARVGDKVFPNFRFNDVTAIHIKNNGSDFSVERKENLWRVRERDDYPANYQQIKDLLLSLRDIKVVQSDTVGPSQLTRVGLVSGDPSRTALSTSEVSTPRTEIATTVEFKDAQGRLLQSIFVGKRHVRPESKSDPFRLHGLFDGCYIRVPSDPWNVLLISDELAAVSPEPQTWLRPDFFRIENPKSVCLTSTNGANLWNLLRETESSSWTLSDAKPDNGEMLNKTAVSQIVEVLPFLTFVDVLPGTAQSSKGLAKPVVLFVETFDHFFYTLKIGTLKPQRGYPVKVAVVTDNSTDLERFHDKLATEKSLMQWVYLVDSNSIKPLLCDRADLLQKKPTVAQDAAGQ